MFRKLSTTRTATATQPPTLFLNNNRSKRFIDQTDTPLFCDRFINPLMNNNTFFSPLDSTAMVDTYPPNAFCTFVLEGKLCSILSILILFADFSILQFFSHNPRLKHYNTHFASQINLVNAQIVINLIYLTFKFYFGQRSLFSFVFSPVLHCFIFLYPLLVRVRALQINRMKFVAHLSMWLVHNKNYLRIRP